MWLIYSLSLEEEGVCAKETSIGKIHLQAVWSCASVKNKDTRAPIYYIYKCYDTRKTAKTQTINEYTILKIYWGAVVLPVRLYKMTEKHLIVCFWFLCVICHCTSQLQSPQCVSHHTTSPQLLPTTLAATGEAPDISNNGAAARQLQWAQADPGFMRLRAFFYSFHATEIPLRKTSGFNHRLETTIKKNQRSNNTVIFVESIYWKAFVDDKHLKCHKTCFFSYIMSMNGNNPT